MAAQDEYSRIEAELERREREIRLRELEREVALELKQDRDRATPSAITPRHRLSNVPEPPLAKISSVGKFAVLVLVTVFLVRTMTWLASTLLVLAIAWGLYQVLADRDRP